jgi:hypothetical protein
MKAYLIIEDQADGGIHVNVLRQMTAEEIEADMPKYHTQASKVMLVLEGQLQALLAEIRIAKAQAVNAERSTCLH